MKTIMVDMDDVLCFGGNLGIVNRFLNTNYTQKDLPGYYAEDLVPVDRLEKYCEYFITQNIYDYVEMMPDAKEVLEKLCKHYKVYICTAYYTDVYQMDFSRLLLDKYQFLQEHYPFLNPYQYVFINDKTIINCDIKIDDRLDNLKGYGETKLLFNSYHNQEISEEQLKEENVTRVSSWKEIEKILLPDM